MALEIVQGDYAKHSEVRALRQIRIEPIRTFAIGTTPVTCTATDASGNTSAPGTFNVTVQDTTPPAISNVPANITVNATGPGGAIVNYSNPTATDLVSGTVPVTCTPASGSTFPVGITPVNCTATDGAGNTATAAFTVTVNPAPALSCDGLAVTIVGFTAWAAMTP